MTDPDYLVMDLEELIVEAILWLGRHRQCGIEWAERIESLDVSGVALIVRGEGYLVEAA